MTLNKNIADQTDAEIDRRRIDDLIDSLRGELGIRRDPWESTFSVWTSLRGPLINATSVDDQDIVDAIVVAALRTFDLEWTGPATEALRHNAIDWLEATECAVEVWAEWCRSMGEW